MERNLYCANDIVNSIKKYSPNQLKLFYGVLYNFKENVRFKQMEQDEEMEMYLSEIKKVTKDSKMSQARILDLVQNMPVEVQFLNSEEFSRVFVFEYIKYNFDEECIKFKMSGTFADILIEMLDRYTIIELEDITSLNSKYSQRLYELSRRFAKQKDYMMKIDDFKEFFDVPSTYRMSNIDQTILKPSIKELEEKTKMRCSYTKKKRGKSISHILFKFSENRRG